MEYRVKGIPPSLKKNLIVLLGSLALAACGSSTDDGAGGSGGGLGGGGAGSGGSGGVLGGGGSGGSGGAGGEEGLGGSGGEGGLGGSGGEGGLGGSGGLGAHGGSGGEEPAPRCGDGIQDEGEECDEGEASATCRDNCTVPFCGDGFVDPGEGCDEGGDGCSAECEVEEGWECNSKMGCFTTCGDGVIAGDEECDVANFGTKTCENSGFSGGELTCTVGCTISTDSCTS